MHSLRCVIYAIANLRLILGFTLEQTTPKDLADRKAAYEEISKACNSNIGTTVNIIPFKKLDFGETQVLDQFYSADLAIIDLSIQDQQNSLIYHLGVRESFGMKQNIMMFNDIDKTGASHLKITGLNYNLLAYKLNEEKMCVALEGTTNLNETKITLCAKLKKMLQDIEIQTKQHMKEKFLSDLRKIRESLTGDELVEALNNMRRRLDDPNVISCETIHNLLISFRDTQNYDGMVNLMEGLNQLPNKTFNKSPVLIFQYIFALNRRNKPGDRQKALKCIQKALEKKENHFMDMICLCGRIYKDLYFESDYTDNGLLENALFWYRKGFELQPNEYAGINLATLLVIQGNTFADSEELKRIGLVLSSLIGRKGDLDSLKEYW